MGPALTGKVRPGIASVGPLYFYGDDKDSGDSYGQGSNQFGAGWYVLKPDGSKIDRGTGAKS